MKVISLSMGAISNVGNLDRLIRFLAGVVLIAVTLLVFDLSSTYLLFAPLIAIPVIGTAIVGWCPVYTLFKVSTVSECVTQKFLDLNVGNTDAIVRLVLGSAFILFAMTSATTEQPWIALSALLAIPLICSGIIGWDPLYGLLRLSTRCADVEVCVIPKPDAATAEKNRRKSNSGGDLQVA